MEPSKHLEQDPDLIAAPVEGEAFIFPLSFAQARLWLLNKLVPDSSVYNMPMTVRLRGPLNVEALRDAFAALLDRHEVLRASFQEEDGSPVQVIPPVAALDIPFIDLSSIPLDEAVLQAHNVARERASTIFDLTRGPLLRVSVVKLADSDHVLVVVIHHIIYDAWSRGILWRELGAYYQSLTAGVEPNVPALEIHYPDFAVWQRDYLSGETLEKELEYWKQQLAGAPASLELHTDHPRPAMQTFNGTEYGTTLPKAVSDSLKDLSRREGATLFMTLLAAFNVLLARYSGQEDIVVGSPIAGRNRAELEGLIGLFVNTLSLRTDLSGNPPFRSLLSRVRETALGAYAHQELPFEKLVEHLKLSRELSRNPIFQVMFALQNVSQQTIEFPALTVEPFRSGKRTTAKFDLSLTAHDSPNGLALVFEYNTDLFEADTIERMAKAFNVLLTAIAEDASRAIYDLPLLEESDLQQLLVEWNASQPSGLPAAQGSASALTQPPPAAVNVTPVRTPILLRLRGALQLSAVRRAINGVVARHESLRTWFMLRPSGELARMVTPFLEIDLAVISLKAFPQRVRELEARRFVHEQSEASFDPAGPFIRASLVKLSDADHVLVINLPQAIAQTWTVEVFKKEFEQFYGEELQESVQEDLFSDRSLARPLTPSTLLHEFIQQQTERTPEAAALIDGTNRVSYRELNARANQLARTLQKLGVGPEVLVAVCTERCADMVVALLAVLKAGGAYVPLDPMYPKDRLAKILEDSRAKVMITQERLTAILPQHSAPVIFVDRDWLAVAEEADSDLDVAVTAKNLAYVLFTSGSTGRPKGVAIEHRNTSIFVQWAQTVFTPEELSGTLFSTSICFDLSIFEMFVPLSLGGTVIIAQNALSLRDLPAASEVRLINTVPSAIAELLRMNAVPDSLLTVNLAGEALPETLARDVYTHTRVRKLYNLYGPTEDTTYSTFTLVPRTGEVTIGRPIANTQAYILDARRHPVPVGVPGELYLAGDGLARGYYGRDDLTAERFVTNPFSAQPNARMYRTGDRCRFRPDGTIEYLGRIDNQVKLRGFRIELGEIEALLTQHPAVQQTVVTVREDNPGDKRLVGYVAAKPGQQPSVVELRDYLKRSLPDYMVPSVIVVLDALPLTPNGKVDRKALPRPETPDLVHGKAVAPRDETERKVLPIWQRVLQNPTMGVTDNFFDLGGHSLMAAQLVSEMEKTFERKIPLAALFRGATVEEMSRLLREGSESEADPIVMRIQAGETVPFFAAVAPGMDSIGYAALAQAMGPKQTFYKLQSHREVKPDAPITLEEMGVIARDYVQAMRSVQPKGPYYLGGMCAGTHIAEQMILQLEAEGEQVGLFAIFDTWVRQNSHVRWKWEIHYYRQRFLALSRMSAGQQIEIVMDALRRKLQRFSSLQKPVETSWEKLYWPGEGFEVPQFEAPIALFKRPRQPFYYINDESMGWRERSQGGVTIYEIDFPHRMLREPYVRELAKHLLESLAKHEVFRVEKPRFSPKVRDQARSAANVEA